MAKRKTRLLRQIDAPPRVVHALQLDADAVAAWELLRGMSCRVHLFEPHEGGRLRLSLAYGGAEVGKSTAHRDTYHGSFVRLEADREVSERLQFETRDTSMQGAIAVPAAACGHVAGWHPMAPARAAFRPWPRQTCTSNG